MHKLYICCTTGITVESIFVSYSVVEAWSSVILILSKNGSTSYDATVSLKIIDGTAEGLHLLNWKCSFVSNTPTTMHSSTGLPCSHLKCDLYTTADDSDTACVYSE